MNLNDVNRGLKRKNKKKKRLGRGPGSGSGKTAARGHKGAGSRAGFSMHPAFEGGQMPIARRVPKRGFNNKFALTIAEINVSDLENWFEAGDEVTIEVLKEKGRLKGVFDELKILGRGELTKKLKVTSHRFSESAKSKIESAGGEVVLLPGKAPVVKNKMGSSKKSS